MKESQFPKDFIWGVSNSAYQVEGGNDNSDWYNWENSGKTKSKNAKSADYWNQFTKDHAIAGQINCNAFRTGLEWSKIEPKEGEFSQEAIQHYRDVLLDIKRQGMQRVVTLNHWTLPLWFAEKGGWHGQRPEKYFTRFVSKAIQEIGNEIDIVLTLNEPTIPLNKGYLAGVFPPGKKSILHFIKARKNMIIAHEESYKTIKELQPNLPVGITQFCNSFETAGAMKSLNYFVKKFQKFYNWGFIKNSINYHDFIGIDYYATFVLSFKFPFFKRMTTNNRWTDMNWGIYPKGLYDVCIEAHANFKKPIYIFENGLADTNDKYRVDFIKEHLQFLNKAISDGADVKGYFHWSLTDNFEWNLAFEPRFGLVGIDFETQERKIRNSAIEYSKICKSNSIDTQEKDQ